jgi:uncharacterized RDD family membrane protein YckC
MKKVEFLSAQHVKIEFEMASVVQRVLAYVIDTVIIYVYFLIVIFAFLNDVSIWSSDLDLALLLLVLLVNMPIYLYKPLMEYFFNGQTVGKMALGIRMVRMNGDRMTLQDNFVRWVMRGDFFWVSLISNPVWIFIIPILTLIDFFALSLSPNNQRFGDMIVSVIAIRTRPARKYKLSDILSRQEAASYKPTYEKVISFTDEDIMYLKNVIEQYKNYKNAEITKVFNAVTQKTCERLEIEMPKKTTTAFLEKVLKDYVYLTR